MSFESVEVVEVVAWGDTVGAVAMDGATGSYAFEYDPEWFDRGVQLAPLYMPNGAGVFVFPSLSPQTFYRLPPLLADSLPDRFGNALIDTWMAQHGVPAAAVTPLDRLAYSANRAMGALEFRPPVGGPDTSSTSVIALADLVNAARHAISGRLADSADAEDALSQLIAVGSSAGGARAKAVIAYHPGTDQIRSGQLDAPDGFEHWLIKLDGVDADPTREPTFADGEAFGIIEYAYYLMARAAGVEMSECRLLREGPRNHFMTRRFDRYGSSGRLHMLSLCGLAHLDFNMAGAHGYEQYLATIDQLELGPEARQQTFRRIVFNVAAVNRDDHTKNLAFLCTDSGEWSLSPAFDITYAHNPSGSWTARHQMTVAGKSDGITRADLEDLGNRFVVPGYRQTIDEVLDAVARWKDFAETAGLGEQITDAISNDHRRNRPS
ncbi:MAG TPA: HipA domain-containing protein [Microthrixaceae bacterium]|nr:HipA domain-containing protein [Microthrixaceae bacterium]